MDHAKRLRDAAKALDVATTERDAAILAAADAGMSRRAIAAEVGLSFQRVQQIVAASRGA